MIEPINNLKVRVAQCGCTRLKSCAEALRLFNAAYDAAEQVYCAGPATMFEAERVRKAAWQNYIRHKQQAIIEVA